MVAQVIFPSGQLISQVGKQAACMIHSYHVPITATHTHTHIFKSFVTAMCLSNYHLICDIEKSIAHVIPTRSHQHSRDD